MADELLAGLEGFTQPELVEATTPALELEQYGALELDLVDVLDNIVDPNSKMLRDLRIDDRDFPEYGNIVDFFLDKAALNISPFARQLWIHVQMWHEWCPSCTKKPAWMANITNCPIDLPADEFGKYVQLTKHGRCPKCGRTKVDHFKSKALKPYQEFAGLLGQRVGKSTMLVAPAAAYSLHKFMKLPRPWEMYGLNPTTLFSTVVAQTYQAAYDQLWIPVKTYIENSSWFVEYHKMLQDIQMRKGEELYSFTTTQLYYKHRALMIYPSGPNRKTLRGKTRFFSATDEHDFFDGADDSEKIKMNGKEVRTSLNNSLANVRIAWEEKVKAGRVNTPTGYSMYVSSPDHAMGVLTQHVKTKQHSSRILALNLATWEVHPKLTRKAIIRAFDPDPMRLERDFGANPPLNSNPFIDDPDLIDRLGDPKRPNRVVIKVESEMIMGNMRLVPEIVKLLEPIQMRPTVLSLDAGYSNNSFALTVLGPPLSDKGDTKCIAHALVEVIPKKGQGKIDFNAVYENLICPIIQKLNVRVLLADRWNSLKLLHDAQAEHGIYVEQYSLKYADFVFVQSYLEGGSVSLPKFTLSKDKRLNPDLTKYPHCFADMPVDHFFFQAVTVRDLGKTVDKGPGLTDDLWRSLVLGARFVLDEEFAKEHLRGSMTRRAAGGIAAGTMMGRVQGHGNSLPSTRHLENSMVAAASGGVGNIVTPIPGVFARTPK